MSRVAYVNGRYLPQREAAVNVEDRGYQFGDGVYEVVHVYDGRFIDEDRHLARLERSLKEIRLTEPMSMSSLRRVLREVVARNRVREGLVYIQVTRGVSRRDHPFPTKPVPPAIVVTTRRLPPFPKDVTRWQTTAITTPDLRWARCDIKSVGLLPNVLARQAAREQGAYEAILVNAEGMVTEGAATSVWIVDQHGTLRTRHLDHVILPGCTRGSLIALMQEAGVPFEERGFSAEELRAAREAFVTSATSYVRPIVRLDGEPIGDGEVGPVTRRLFELFARHVQGGLRNAA
ncbi:MAG: D-amino-acid transaminase [Alphaproteobacteria bacterium]|nr:D-amino-acid transaminase [Alphaproteobacteria bacterium]